MGSGHVLVYAFEVLYEIYLSQGYQVREIPKLILEKNLYGFEIDERATQLAYFALLMKGRQYDTRIFDKSIETNLLAIEESNHISTDEINLYAGDDEELRKSFETVIETFYNGKLFGSIIEMPEIDFTRLRE